MACLPIELVFFSLYSVCPAHEQICEFLCWWLSLTKLCLPEETEIVVILMFVVLSLKSTHKKRKKIHARNLYIYGVNYNSTLFFLFSYVSPSLLLSFAYLKLSLKFPELVLLFSCCEEVWPRWEGDERWAGDDDSFTQVPIPRTTIPDSPSRSKLWEYLWEITVEQISQIVKSWISQVWGINIGHKINLLMKFSCPTYGMIYWGLWQ